MGSAQGQADCHRRQRPEHDGSTRLVGSALGRVAGRPRARRRAPHLAGGRFASDQGSADARTQRHHPFGKAHARTGCRWGGANGSEGRSARCSDPAKLYRWNNRLRAPRREDISPGAISAPAPDNVTDYGNFTDSETLREMYRVLGADGSKSLGVYCGAGMSAVYRRRIGRYRHQRCNVPRFVVTLDHRSREARCDRRPPGLGSRRWPTGDRGGQFGGVLKVCAARLGIAHCLNFTPLVM